MGGLRLTLDRINPQELTETGPGGRILSSLPFYWGRYDPTTRALRKIAPRCEPVSQQGVHTLSRATSVITVGLAIRTALIRLLPCCNTSRGCRSLAFEIPGAGRLLIPTSRDLNYKKHKNPGPLPTQGLVTCATDLDITRRLAPGPRVAL